MTPAIIFYWSNTRYFNHGSLFNGSSLVWTSQGTSTTPVGSTTGPLCLLGVG